MASDSYKKYSTFSNIECPKLKAWNRMTTMANIEQDLGKNQAGMYLTQFEGADQMAIMATVVAISKEGYEEVKRKLARGQ